MALSVPAPQVSAYGPRTTRSDCSACGLTWLSPESMRAGPAAKVRVPSTKTPICSAYSPRTDGSRLMAPRLSAVTPAWSRNDCARSRATRRSMASAAIVSSVATSGISADTVTSCVNAPTSSVSEVETPLAVTAMGSVRVSNPSSAALSR